MAAQSVRMILLDQWPVTRCIGFVLLWTAHMYSTAVDPALTPTFTYTQLALGGECSTATIVALAEFKRY